MDAPRKSRRNSPAESRRCADAAERARRKVLARVSASSNLPPPPTLCQGSRASACPPRAEARAPAGVPFLRARRGGPRRKGDDDGEQRKTRREQLEVPRGPADEGGRDEAVRRRPARARAGAGVRAARPEVAVLLLEADIEQRDSAARRQGEAISPLLTEPTNAAHVSRPCTLVFLSILPRALRSPPVGAVS